jgi:hypothetical protein
VAFNQIRAEMKSTEGPEREEAEPAPMRAGYSGAESPKTAAARSADEPDRRGWFYRVVAPGPDLAVLEIGAPFIRNWFSNVVSYGSGALCRQPSPGPRFAMVILHLTLGGCASIAEALRAAHGLLEPGGIVALAGVNRIRVPATYGAPAPVPRATPWGYRSAARHAGFSRVDLYVAQPDFDESIHVVSTASASSRAFFRHELAARSASGRNRLPLARRLLAELNLAPHLQPFYFVVGRKC